MVKIFSFFLFFIISLKLYAIDTKAEQAVVIDFDTNEVLFENAPKDPVLLDNRVNLVESERLIAIKVKNFESLVAVIISQPWS